MGSSCPSSSAAPLDTSCTCVPGSDVLEQPAAPIRASAGTMQVSRDRRSWIMLLTYSAAGLPSLRQSVALAPNVQRGACSARVAVDP